MSETVIREVIRERGGKQHTFPISALAEHVVESDDRQFISKRLKEQLTEDINGLKESSKSLNDRLDDMSLEREGDTIYIVYGEGADTVRKKLGNEFVPWKNVDIKNERNYINAQTVTVDCTDIQGYDQLTKDDFLVVPTSVYEKNHGQESIHELGRVNWNYNDGILTINNSVCHITNESDGQQVDMWYSGFEIYK
ncbi:hypothetical protein AALA79_01645 [Lachnospiraceae bacterium 64-25]